MLEALKRYGMIVADNGSDWFISAPRPALEQRRPALARSRERLGFEVVDTTSLAPR